MTQRPEGWSPPRAFRDGTFGEVPAALFARWLVHGKADRARIDRFTALAARLLNAPSAQVSIIGDAQVVIAGVGAGESLLDAESDAADSLCTVTVRRASPLEVNDAPSHPEVRHLPPVTSGAVGAYLGAPLDVGGHLVGALCVYDERPRSWTAEDTSLLMVLADAVAAELQSAALEASFAQDREIWQLAVDAAGVGAFDWDLRSGDLRWDDRLLAIFGTTREAFGGTIEAFQHLVHPDDLDRVTADLTASIETCSEFAAEYRISTPDGSARWVSARGRAYPDEAGNAVRFIGAAFDSTAVQQGEARVARVLETMSSAFYHLDRRWCFTYANAEAQRMLAGVSEDVVGRNIWELFSAATGSIFEESYRRAMETGVPETFEAYYPPPLDGWYEVRAWPSPDGLSVYFHDITSRRNAEQELSRVTERKAMLAEVTASLTDTFETVEAVGRLTQLLVPRMGEWCLVSLIDDPEPFARRDWRRHVRDIGSWHRDPAQRPLVERYSRLRIPALGDDSYLARAVRDGVPVVLTHHATEEIAAHLDAGEAQDLYRELGPAHVVILPIHGRGRTVGALTIARGPDAEPFTTDELEGLGEVSARAGLVLDNTLLFGRQRDLAEGLQHSLLSPPPRADGLEVAVRYVPAAEMAQVGGDWHDTFRTRDGLMVVIGDVMGHDTVAAAAMGQLRAMLRAIAVTTDEDPASVLASLDQAMETLRLETTASAVVAHLTPAVDSGGVHLRWSNAGHPPPLMAHTDAEGHVKVTALVCDETDTLLGIDSNCPRTGSTVDLPYGALLLLYTDGLVERRDQTLDLGLERLSEVFGDLATQSLDPEKVADALLARLLPPQPEDDVALIVVKVQPQTRAS